MARDAMARRPAEPAPAPPPPPHPRSPPPSGAARAAPTPPLAGGIVRPPSSRQRSPLPPPLSPPLPQPSPPPLASTGVASPAEEQQRRREQQQQRRQQQQAERQRDGGEERGAEQQRGEKRGGGGPGGVRRATNQREHDERPIAAAPLSGAESEAAEGVDDVPPPEPLEAASRKEAEACGLLELYGEEVAARVFSRSWQVRQSGMAAAAAKAPSLVGERRALAAAAKVMLIGASDKMARPQPRNSRPPPFLRPSLTRRVRAAPGALGSRDAERELRPLLLSWRDKLSDSNGRVREAAEGALLALCSLPAIGPSAVGALLVAPLPPAKRNSSQAWLGRLAPLQRLLREHGPQGGEEAGGFEVGPDQCQFCLRRDAAWVSEEALDLHFWKECPLLTSCEQCGQVVEAAGLNEHLLSECDCSKPFRYGPPLGEDAEYVGCPFCQQPLPSDIDGLRRHLAHECAANPRLMDQQ
ncbi:hypothetical protein EMIHUDRAFT_454873 [Emiliania huxleyi CCMP1516]|uniref:Centrosomal protein CEP104 Zn finger domain-containing protein n=2 Tax=Emiliania huxleyi TaxID=2903 RepID=A0A0D3KP34_EMIH1|nr:hypothetical protein EMIHUDRAFT_454873 [Emiliania huxleyi CCMP1516]EOD37519.1 hypothetical protein EMIHUDRAFT_454873 [Emiliania huxleyi CCMP1516]|eukprot:XP_005789948.1 hypothetical protein EMIHUDRAFT_454873 [Emiliania huxleyi CCMP1516]